MGRDIPQDHLLLEAGRAEKRLARVRRDAPARHAISGRTKKQRVNCFGVWMNDAPRSGLYAMQRFARVLRRGVSAVRNTITEPWSKWANGRTESPKSSQTNDVWPGWARTSPRAYRFCSDRRDSNCGRIRLMPFCHELQYSQVKRAHATRGFEFRRKLMKTRGQLKSGVQSATAWASAASGCPSGEL